MCIAWTLGNCYDVNCPLRHIEDPRSDEYCYFEGQPQGCQNPRCPYRHMAGGIRASNAVTRSRIDFSPATETKDGEEDDNVPEITLGVDGCVMFKRRSEYERIPEAKGSSSVAADGAETMEELNCLQVLSKSVIISRGECCDPWLEDYLWNKVPQVQHGRNPKFKEDVPALGVPVNIGGIASLSPLRATHPSAVHDNVGTPNGHPCTPGGKTAMKRKFTNEGQTIDQSAT